MRQFREEDEGGAHVYCVPAEVVKLKGRVSSSVRVGIDAVLEELEGARAALLTMRMRAHRELNEKALLDLCCSLGTCHDDLAMLGWASEGFLGRRPVPPRMGLARPAVFDKLRRQSEQAKKNRPT